MTEKSEPIICKNCGFDKNRISGHIFVRSFEDGGRMIEEVRCKECGNVPDYIMMTDKIVKIIYRNFDGSKEYFDNLKKKLESHGYSVIRPLKNDSLSDTLEDMFVNNPEPSQEKPLSDDDIVKKFWNKYPRIGWKTIEEIVKETREQTTAKNKPNQHETDLAIIARLTAENDTLKSMRNFWIKENKKLEEQLKESERKIKEIFTIMEKHKNCTIHAMLNYLKEKYGEKK